MHHDPPEFRISKFINITETERLTPGLKGDILVANTAGLVAST